MAHGHGLQIKDSIIWKVSTKIKFGKIEKLLQETALWWSVETLSKTFMVTHKPVASCNGLSKSMLYCG